MSLPPKMMKREVKLSGEASDKLSSLPDGGVIEDDELLDILEKAVQPLAHPPLKKEEVDKPPLPVDLGKPQQDSGKIKPMPRPTKSIRSNQPAGIKKTKESLPVLEAFQEFLDKEQKQMRRRLVRLSSFFIVLVILLTAAAGGLSYLFLAPMLSSVDDLNSKYSELKLTIDDETARLRASQADAAKAVGEVSKVSADVNDMRELVAKLEKDNTAINEQMVSMKTGMPSVEEKLAAIMKELDILRARAVPPAVADTAAEKRAPVSVESTVAEPAGPSEEMTVEFTPLGSSRKVTCLLPSY